MPSVLYLEKNVFRANALAYFATNRKKRFITLTPEQENSSGVLDAAGDSWGQCYKTFYSRKLRIFALSQSICRW
jgi:hypothetical protein